MIDLELVKKQHWQVNDTFMRWYKNNGPKTYNLKLCINFQVRFTLIKTTQTSFPMPDLLSHKEYKLKRK